jgi:NADH-ubiquinone oxidoreductase chain 4
VKIPSFFLHLWLPKAHVEAPVSGSIILAGLLLKLGVYGLYIFIPFVFHQLILFRDFFFIWGLWGALVSSFICFRQVDLRKIIAYISIMHIGIVISSVFSFLLYSLFSVFLILLAHGLTSSGLFYSLNCFYERLYSRSIFLAKGGSYILPSLFFWFTIVISSNISLPPSFNFFSELILCFSVLHYHIINFIVLFILIFMGSLVSFHILISLFHGFDVFNFRYNDINLKEMILSFFHIFPIFTLFLFL